MIALLRDENGSTLTEYGVLMFSFAIASIAGLVAIGQTANNVLSQVLTATTNLQLCPPWDSAC